MASRRKGEENEERERENGEGERESGEEGTWSVREFDNSFENLPRKHFNKRRTTTLLKYLACHFF